MIVNTILSDKVKTRRPLQFVPISREKTIKWVANYYEGHRPGSGYSAIVDKYGGGRFGDGSWWIVVDRGGSWWIVYRSWMDRGLIVDGSWMDRGWKVDGSWMDCGGLWWNS